MCRTLSVQKAYLEGLLHYIEVPLVYKQKLFPQIPCVN